MAATFDAMWSAIAGIGRDPSTGGYRRFAWTDRRPRAARVVRRRGGRARAGPGRGPDGQPVGLVGRSRSVPGRGHRLASGQRARRRCVRRPAGRGQCLRRDRCAARPGVPARPADRRRQLRRRGGGPVRRRLRRLPGDHRRAARRTGAGPDRRRRSQHGRRSARGRPAARGLRPRPGGAGPDRPVSSNCTSSRAAAWSIAVERSAWPATSGRTGGGGSTCPGWPTTPAPPGWRIARTRCSAVPNSCWPRDPRPRRTAAWRRWASSWSSRAG